MIKKKNLKIFKYKNPKNQTFLCSEIKYTYDKIIYYYC